MMKIDLSTVNSTFQDISINPKNIVFLDANILIPPDRSDLGVKPIGFNFYAVNFLMPLFDEFSGLSIHESVYEELVDVSVRNYADEKIKSIPIGLKLHHDSELDKGEIEIMNLYLKKLSIHSKYDPQLDNKKDRGEIRSLAFMATKNFDCFSARDYLPVLLIKDAHRLNTGLEKIGIIQAFELLYYLYKTDKYDNKALRNLYKYQYFLTKREKMENPEWSEFIQRMNELYDTNKLGESNS